MATNRYSVQINNMFLKRSSSLKLQSHPPRFCSHNHLFSCSRILPYIRFTENMSWQIGVSSKNDVSNVSIADYENMDRICFSKMKILRHQSFLQVTTTVIRHITTNYTETTNSFLVYWLIFTILHKTNRQTIVITICLDRIHLHYICNQNLIS